MPGGQVYALEETTYPLVPEAVAAGVTIPEEIACLLDAGWTWDGNKLVHPGDKTIWRRYQKIDSQSVRPSQLDAEIERAVRAARRAGGGG